VSQQRPQRFKGGRRSKEKLAKNHLVNKIQEKKTFTVLRG
jgi:hypothetical protein